MNKTIHKLDKNLINQIAAGEVVERPASVVKELIENALDAKSTSISLHLENAGMNLIKVVDNGVGLNIEDFPLLLEKHATSKIKNIQDLESTLSLGFRGEALASISAVSKFIFKSKALNADIAHSIDQNGEIQICSLNQGTQVEVKDLFYNLPARREYLKTPSTEYSQIVKILSGYFLAHPQVAFQVTHNNKVVFNLAQSDFKQRVQDVLGSDFANKTLAVYYQGQNLTLNGFISKPEFCVGKKPEQFLLVNDRPLKADVFSVAVRNAFGSLIFPNQKPQFILNIQVQAKDIDMNIHPRKLEARFKYQSILFATILKAVRTALSKADLKKLVELKRPSLSSFLDSPHNTATSSDSGLPCSSSQASNPSLDSSIHPAHQSFVARDRLTSATPLKQSTQAFSHDQTQAFPTNTPSLQTNSQSAHSSSMEIFQDSLQYIGQLRDSYLLFQSKSGLTIIDQHAAHEKVKYFEIRNKMANYHKHSQKLLTPQSLSLSAAKLAVLQDALPVFQKLGFEIEISSSQVLLQSVPLNLSQIAPETLLLELLDDFLNQNTKNLIELEDIAINYAACRSAIKFGQSMQEVEVNKLLESLDSLKEEKYSCPHGRPSTIEVGFAELERLFLRKK